MQWTSSTLRCASAAVLLATLSVGLRPEPTHHHLPTTTTTTESGQSHFIVTSAIASTLQPTMNYHQSGSCRPTFFLFWDPLHIILHWVKWLNSIHVSRLNSINFSVIFQDFRLVQHIATLIMIYMHNHTVRFACVLIRCWLRKPTGTFMKLSRVKLSTSNVAQRLR